MASDADLAEVALTRAEYAHLVESLGREPNRLELGIVGALWSEHCSYKTSKPLLRTLPTTGPRVLQGPGENAGAIDIGDGLACVFKIESHNHPSAIEPYQGAATGVGGILRDIFTMGARPVALLDSLRFGPLDDAASTPPLRRRCCWDRWVWQLHRRANRGRGAVLRRVVPNQLSRQRDVRRRRGAGQADPRDRERSGQPGAAGRCRYGARRDPRCQLRFGRSRCGQCRAPARGAGRQSLPREVPDGGVPGACRRSSSDRHAGPRGRRALWQHGRAGASGRLRHRGRRRTSVPPRDRHDAVRGDAQRVAGADADRGANRRMCARCKPCSNAGTCIRTWSP